MKLTEIPSPPPVYLGIEAGATKCVAILAESFKHCLSRLELAEPGNLRLLSDAQLRDLLGRIARQVPRPAAVGIGMAGALNEGDRERIRQAVASIWPGIPCWAGHDLETALAAAGDVTHSPIPIRVIVISGTGASCYGQLAGGGEVLTGGWGHLLGDGGSGYDIAMRGMQAVFRALDLTGKWPNLGQRLLLKLELDSPAALVAWVGSADKPAIAALAVEMFAAAAARDPIAKEILSEAAVHVAGHAPCLRQTSGTQGQERRIHAYRQCPPKAAGVRPSGRPGNPGGLAGRRGEIAGAGRRLGSCGIGEAAARDATVGPTDCCRCRCGWGGNG